MNEVKISMEASTRKKLGNIIRSIIGLIVSVIMVFPIYVTIVGGFKGKGQFFVNPFGLPRPVSLEAYKTILGWEGIFWTFLFNSVLIVVGVLLIVLFFSMTAAFVLSRIPFKGNKLLLNFFVMGMLFPLTVAVLPLYLQLKNFNLLGSLWGVILSEAAFNFPLSIFIFTGFFKDIPRDLQDACLIDGGSQFLFFYRIMVPLSRPVISTVSIIVFIMSWNQFLLPLLVLSDPGTFTIPLGVMQYQGQFTTGWNYIMAFITISILPMAVFYYSLQKHIVAGLTTGAVKG